MGGNWAGLGLGRCRYRQQGVRRLEEIPPVLTSFAGSIFRRFEEQKHEVGKGQRTKSDISEKE